MRRQYQLYQVSRAVVKRADEIKHTWDVCESGLFDGEAIDTWFSVSMINETKN